MKTDLLTALLADIPASVGGYLETPFGTINTIDMPTDKDAAAVACGQLAANINNAFLKPFCGLTPIEVLMRLGSKNAVQIAALLSGLEIIAGAGGKIKLERPVNGETYAFINSLVVSGIGIQSVTGTLNDGETLQFSDMDDVWNYTFDPSLDAGDYTLNVSATFDDESTATARAAFTVERAQNAFGVFSPRSGQSYPSTDMILFDTSGTNIASVQVDVEGKSFQLEHTGEHWTASLSLAAGEYVANFVATFNDGDSMPANVSFIAG